MLTAIDFKICRQGIGAYFINILWLTPCLLKEQMGEEKTEKCLIERSKGHCVDEKAENFWIIIICLYHRKL